MSVFLEMSSMTSIPFEGRRFESEVFRLLVDLGECDMSNVSLFQHVQSNIHVWALLWRPKRNDRHGPTSTHCDREGGHGQTWTG